MTEQEQREFIDAWHRGDSVATLSRRFDMAEPNIRRWRKKLNLPTRQIQLKPPPNGFVTDVERERLSLGALRKKYRVTVDTIKRWAKEAGVELQQYAPPHLRKRDTPADWHAVAPTLTFNELRKHYNMSNTLVRRLLRETGIKPKRGRAGVKRMLPQAASNGLLTDCDAAAHHLRRFFRCVHRCDIKLYSENDPVRRHITWGSVRGVPHDGVGYYYVDTLGIVANKDVVMLARKHGWKGTYDSPPD